MYAIRARAVDGVLEARFSGNVAPEEALRAISQAFALADAGAIRRGICDLREMRPGAGDVVFLGAAFAARSTAGQRIAVICSPRQLSLCSRLARLAGYGEQLGIFTREADAEAWLHTAQHERLAQTALRHVVAPPTRTGEIAGPKSNVRVA